VRDTNDNIFGGCFSQPLEIKEDFYGTGESFLYKFSVRKKKIFKKISLKKLKILQKIFSKKINFFSKDQIV